MVWICIYKPVQKGLPWEADFHPWLTAPPNDALFTSGVAHSTFASWAHFPVSKRVKTLTVILHRLSVHALKERFLLLRKCLVPSWAMPFD